MNPRCVLVQRPTEYDELLARHATREQLRFFLEERGRSLEEVVERHERLAAALRAVQGAIPRDWRRATVARAEIDRFLFAADDVVLVVGQDGLVANVAKYLAGQPVIGLNPEPERWPGVLVPHPPAAAADLLHDVAAARATLQERTMVEARLDDGQRLLALNEVFLGHASHQSARYTLEVAGQRERQSSSGVIVSTGTGATGWAASIARERGSQLALPSPGDPALAFFVREAWPSLATGTGLTDGLLRDGAVLTLQSEMGDAGVVFGDGIEDDRLPLDWGRRVHVAVARERLRVVR
jgi:NAD kinase